MPDIDTTTDSRTWLSCSHCIGQTTQMPDGIWVHEDGEAGCYAATPNLAWPDDDSDRPSGYEGRAAQFWGKVHPAFERAS